MNEMLTENDAEEAVGIVQMMLAAEVGRRAEKNDLSKQAVFEQIAEELQSGGVKVSGQTIRRLAQRPVDELTGAQIGTVFALAPMLGLKIGIRLEKRGEGT